MLDEATWSGADAFQQSSPNVDYFADTAIPVNTSKSYRLTGIAGSGNSDGSAYQSTNKQYFGFASYDVDGKVILPRHVMKFAGATDTTLAAALKPGDPIIVLAQNRWLNCVT